MVTIKLLGNDARALEVDSFVVAKTMKISTYVIPVRETSSETLAMVINFCNMKVVFDQNVNGMDRQLVEINRKNWTARFFSVSQTTLLDLAVAAKFLGINSLFDQACEALRSRLIP